MHSYVEAAKLTCFGRTKPGISASALKHGFTSFRAPRIRRFRVSIQLSRISLFVAIYLLVNSIPQPGIHQSFGSVFALRAG